MGIAIKQRLKEGVATVVILPTLWSGPWIWREQKRLLDTFSSRHFLVEEAIANWRTQPQLEDLDAYVLNQIDAAPKPWLLVGGSLGGLLALRLAALRPECVTGVIASGCPGLGRGGELGVRLTSPPGPEDLRRIREAIFVDPACLSDGELELAATQVAGRDASKQAVRLLRALKSYDPGHMLRALQRPTALIWGQHDQLTPGAPWRVIACTNPYLSFREVPAAGHVPMMEAPERFRAALEAIWK